MAKPSPLLRRQLGGDRPDRVSEQGKAHRPRHPALLRLGIRPHRAREQHVHSPFRMWPIDNANVSAGRVGPRKLTSPSATLNSWAMGPTWAVAIRPPALTSAIMK